MQLPYLALAALVFIDTVIWPHSATRHTQGSAEAKFSPVICGHNRRFVKDAFWLESDIRHRSGTSVGLNPTQPRSTQTLLQGCCLAIWSRCG